ncbi:uncharacterized protein LOC110844257 [Folsomia candida]|uniref:uncharacterized protein LOC110844257 n=1 Tax=Folsomia candida TaxID=158441 RepID=UPI000B8F3F79|nr:uncharacterized protein LOC110844257 [Folsomia candida]
MNTVIKARTMNFGENLLNFQGKIPRPKFSKINTCSGSNPLSNFGNNGHHDSALYLSRTTPPPDYLSASGGDGGGASSSSASSVSSFGGGASGSSSDVFTISMSPSKLTSDLANITNRLDKL